MKRSGLARVAELLIALFIAIPLALSVAGCGHISQNIERDGYQVGDISDGLQKDKAWYCGPGMMGIRALARGVIALFTGTTIPNVCAVVDAVIDESRPDEPESL